MADLQKLVHGEPSWDVKHNALVDVVEKMGGVVNGLQWTKPTDDGIVFLNGWSGRATYSYLQIGDKKIVDLQVVTKGNAKAGQYTEIFAIPDNVKPKNRMLQCRYWQTIGQISDNKMGVLSTDELKADQNNWTYVGDFIYVI